MSEEKQTKFMRQISLKVDQFEINEDGELVIKSNELAEAIQSQLSDVTPTEAGTISTSIRIKP